MYLIVLSTLFIASGGGAQLGETDNCDSNELKVCVDLIPRTPVGLPKTREELDLHCSAYQTGMACMDTWIKRCLPTDGQKLVQQQIGGARAIMRFLCTNETALRRVEAFPIIRRLDPDPVLIQMMTGHGGFPEYVNCFKCKEDPSCECNPSVDGKFLKEPSCWGKVSPDWTRCVDELQDAVRDITDRAQQLTYFNRNAELCCARDAFIMCVGHAGRSCSSSAGTLLRRMAWVLAQDVAACTQHPRATCAAPAPPFAAPLLTAIYALLYPQRF